MAELDTPSNEPHRNREARSAKVYGGGRHGVYSMVKWFADCSTAAGPVRVTSPAPRDAWARVLQADSQALVTQSPEWLDAMTGTGRYMDVSRLYEFADDRRFVLPMVQHRGSALRLTGAASNPDAWGAGGMVGEEIDARVVAAVVADVSRSSSWRVRIRPNPLQAALYLAAVPDRAVVIRRRAHVLDLPNKSREVWDRQLSSACRRSIRKAEQAGLEVETDSTGRLAPVFHDLFTRSIDRWAGQQHEPRFLARLRAAKRDPLSKWETIARSLAGACHFWVARHRGVAVAAIVVLRGANAHYTRGAMDKELAGPLRANHLLMWCAIQDAIDHGCHAFHMGESGASAGLARYKEQFGATPYDYADYVLERLPLTRIDAAARHAVKRAVRFKDA
jgi:Acetyltransferase (GNAT) domain